MHRLATAEPVRAAELPPGSITVVSDDEAFEQRVDHLVQQFTTNYASQPQALGKWAFWTQASFQGTSGSGDGYEEAVAWAGRAMALHARGDDAREGMEAFVEKRKAVWKT